MCHLCQNKQRVQEANPLLAEQEVLKRKDIAPFAARNKGGVPVTRLRAKITLKDHKPAFAIRTEMLGRTPHIISGIGGLPGKRVPIETKENRPFVSLPSNEERGNGGVLFLPIQGSNIIELYAWNTAPMGWNPFWSNSSHAEVQFIRWFIAHVRQQPHFKYRVRQIELWVSRPPCNACTHDLGKFAADVGLIPRLKISWDTDKKKEVQLKNHIEACSKLTKNRWVLPSCERKMQAEMPPPLARLKIEKQQDHSYILDKRVHSGNPKADNRREKRLVKDGDGFQASLLSRVFASPHNRNRVKRLFQGAINRGNFKPSPRGGWESTITFKQPTGWTNGKQVNRLRAIIDHTGGWHFHPAP